MTDTHAGGQALGYVYQFIRCLVWLLRSKPGDVVVFEEIGDVGVRKPDGFIVAEEDKSGLTVNPIANRATAFWKSLFNWLNAIDDGHLNPKRTQFVLSILQDHRGEWAQTMNDADTTDAAKVLMDQWRQEFNQNPPAYGIKKYVNFVLDQNNETNMMELIQRFHLETGSGHSFTDIRSTFVEANQNIDASEADDLIKECLGWVQGEITRQLESGSGYAVISVDQYRTWLNKTTSRLRDDHVLLSYVPSPAEDDINKTAHSQAVFLRQLEFIEYSDERIDAAKKFLWAKADITTWLERGLTDGRGIDQLNDELIELYKLHDKKSRLQHSTNEIARGQYTFHGCQGEKPMLGGRHIDQNYRFIPGVYHHLADAQRVGWHPRYLELLALKALPQDDAA